MNWKTFSVAAFFIATIAIPGASQTLTVSVTGSGKVTGAGIDCGSDCSETLPPVKIISARLGRPNTVVLTASGPGMAAGGVNWGGACQATTGPVCTVSVPAGGAAVSALFATVSGPDIGGAIGDAIGNMPSFEPKIAGPGTLSKSVSGTVVTYRAEPNQGARFAGWSGACTGTNPVCNYTQSSQFVNLKASFGWLVTVMIEGPGGRVTGTGIDCPTVCSVVAVPPTLTLTAAPTVSSASHKEWGGDCKTGANTTSGSVCSLSVTGPKAVSAKFEVSLLAPTP